MADYKILNASHDDASAMCDIFLAHISAHTEYISHGEIQMGVGTGYFKDGEFITGVAPEARAAWMKYITGNLADEEGAAVYKAVDADGTILGFCVTEIMEDGADPFAMVCDVLVKEDLWNKLKVDYPNNINGDYIDIDGVSFTYRSTDFFEPMDNIMKKSDIIDGYHVMNLEETVKWKEKVGTEKHLEDANLIKNYLGKLEAKL
jgi:hypothetical protein